MGALMLRYIGERYHEHPASWPQGSAFPVLGPMTLVGRDPTRSDIVLRSPHIARRHACLRLAVDSMGNRSCWLEDLGGTNGIYTQGSDGLLLLTCNMSPHRLHIGDRLWIAGMFEFELTL
jgi:pSer/pThr/pTyr-binding forkhead associated (FHA) protein